MKVGSLITINLLKLKLRNGNINAANELAHIYLSEASQKKQEEMGIKYLTLAANNNIIQAQHELAEYYLNGKFVLQDTEISMYWFLTASDCGSDSAWERVKTIASELNPFTVIQWCEKIIDKNIRHANILLGNFYCNEIQGGGSLNYNKAAEAYDRAITLGTDSNELPLENLVNISSNFYKQENFEKSIYWYRITAGLGHSYSQYILGRYYIDGIGVDKDYDLAFRYFEDSAKNGFLESKKYLGLYYIRGIGNVPQNPQLALELFNEVSSTFKEVHNYIGKYYIDINDFVNAVENYEKADEASVAIEEDGSFLDLSIYFDSIQNYSKAVYWLNLSYMRDADVSAFLIATYHFYGYHFEKDQEKGIGMLVQLAESAYQPALLMLYNIYENGLEGVQHNKTKAFSALRSLAESGDVEAIKMMGDAFMEKDNPIVAQDYEQAAKWYDKWYRHQLRKGSIDKNHLEDIGVYFYRIRNYKLAVKWCKRAVKEGSVTSSYILGICYFNGDGVNTNHRLAFRYFEDSAKNGYLKSKVYLGLYYIRGIGTVYQNPQLALELFDEVSSTYKEVYNYIGKYYLDNNDFVNAVENYEKADEAGVAVEEDKEFYDLAIYLDSIQDYTKAVHWLKLSSKKSSHEGHLLLAKYYFNGYCFERDRKKGIEVLEQLAEEAYQPALWLLYDIYDKGLEGIQQNRIKAINILSRLAEAGDVDAIKLMGDAFMQKDSSTVEQDYKQATEWYDKWYRHPRKKGSIDKNYLEEIGVYYLGIKDYKSANRWCIRAIGEGSLTAYVHLGKIAGINSNHDEEFNYYMKAAEAEIPQGLAYLAYCYINGRGTNVDYVKAYEYFTLAAEKDDVFGMYGQAFCLINKLGVKSTKEDGKKIFTLLSKAAEREYSTVYELLSNCYELGIGTEVSIDKAVYYLFKCKPDNDLLKIIEEKKYSQAYEYIVEKIKENKNYIYFKMILTYFGLGTMQNKEAACEMFVDFYTTDSLRDNCGNNTTRPVFKYRIAKEAIEAGNNFERNREYEKAIKYYKAAFRFNPRAGIFLARILFENDECDVIPLLNIMSGWRDKDTIYKKSKSIANYMLGLYYEYYYSKIVKQQTKYTEGYKFYKPMKQEVYTMMEHYKNSSEDEAYKRICQY